MSNANSSKVLWGAVAVLGAATLVLGGMVLRANHTSAPPQDIALTATAPSAAASSPATPISAAVEPKAAAEAPAHTNTATAKKPVPKQAAAKSGAAGQKAEQVIGAAPPATAVTTGEPAPKTVERIPPAPLCAVCGTVESVTALQRDAASGSGLGVIAGAALGGLLGNQVGGGTGKDLATIAGMVGGGWAGNTVEKKMKKETVYEIAVRMEDGSLRRMEHKTAVSVGTKVTVNGNTLTPVSPAQ